MSDWLQFILQTTFIIKSMDDPAVQTRVLLRVASCCPVTH